MRRHRGRFSLLSLGLIALFASLTVAESVRADAVETGLNPAGGGFYIKTKDISLTTLAYVQALGTFASKKEANPWGFADFKVQRTRIDWWIEAYKHYEMFIELDAALHGGTGLVWAWAQAQLMGKALQLRAGKMTSWFFEENIQGSRGLKTVFRSSAANTLFFLPIDDSQIGLMAWGELDVMKGLTYGLMIFNGNNSVSPATGNFSDVNRSKQLVGRLQLKPTDGLRLGVGASTDEEPAQKLLLFSKVNTFAGVAYFLEAPVSGRRKGISFDVAYDFSEWGIEVEGLLVDWESGPKYYGGYGQLTHWLEGDATKGGVQLVGRYEFIRAENTGVNGDTIQDVVLGVNWHLNGYVRVQANYVAEFFNGPGNRELLVGLGGDRFLSLLLTQLQVKF